MALPTFYLRLNGVEIPCQRGGLLEPSRYGERVRMYNNRLRSTEEPDFRTRRWQFATGPLDGAEWLAIAPVLRSTAVLAGTGMALTRGETAIAVLCVLGEVTHLPKGDTDIRYEAVFTLYERSTASSAIGGVTTPLVLFGDPSPVGGGSFRAGPGGTGTAAGGEASGGVPITCGSTLPAGGCDTARCPSVTTIIGTWYSDVVTVDTMLYGQAQFNGGAVGINPWGSWWTQRVGIQMSIYRAGAVVAGPFPFTTRAVDFSGGSVTLVTVNPLVNVPVLAGDRLKFEYLSIIGLNGCTPDDGFRPRMGYGGFFPPNVVVPATLVF